MTDVSQLLPCPFCGKVPLIVCPDDSYGSAFVTCGDANDCPVSVTADVSLGCGKTIADASAAWNTRAQSGLVTEDAVTCGAAAIIDLWLPGIDWRHRLDESVFLESADWQAACDYARAALAASDQSVWEIAPYVGQGGIAHHMMVELACAPVLECDQLDDDGPREFIELNKAAANQINDILGAVRDAALTKGTPDVRG